MLRSQLFRWLALASVVTGILAMSGATSPIVLSSTLVECTIDLSNCTFNKLLFSEGGMNTQWKYSLLNGGSSPDRLDLTRANTSAGDQIIMSVAFSFDGSGQYDRLAIGTPAKGKDSSLLTVAGMIESTTTSGGVKFPDGSIQRSAASNYTKGEGLNLVGTTLSLATPTENTLGGVKSHICGGTDKVTGIGTDGLVRCGLDGNTTYSAGIGLRLDGTIFSLDRCPANNQVLRWNALGWSCADYLTYSAGPGLRLISTTFALAEPTAATLGGIKSAECPQPTEKVTGVALDGSIRCGLDNNIPPPPTVDRLGGVKSLICAPSDKVAGIDASGSVLCDRDKDTTYTASQGIELTSNDFRLKPCNNDQVLKFASTTGWICAVYPTYLAGEGLFLGPDNRFSIKSCADGQILKSKSFAGGGTSWNCATDIGIGWVLVPPGGPDLVLDPTIGRVGIGPPALLPRSGRLLIADSVSPLGLWGTNVSTDQGGLWRIAIDHGILRFDVNRAPIGREFAEGAYLTPLALSLNGGVSVNGNLGVGKPSSEVPVDVQATTISSVDLDIFRFLSFPVGIGFKVRLSPDDALRSVHFDYACCGQFEDRFKDILVFRGGNVGIGTDNPGAKLNVAGNLLLGMPGGTESPRLLFTPSEWRISSQGEVLRIHKGEGPPPAMLFDKDGNVGIGTTNPSDKLVVDGHVRIKRGADPRLILERTSTDPIVWNFEVGQFVQGNGFAITDLTHGAQKLIMEAKRDSTEGNVLFPTGNVGIGRAPDPAYKLDVQGKVRASGGFNGRCLQESSPPFNANSDRICNQDLAEAYTSAEPTEPGDLLVLVPGAESSMRKSVRPYEDLLAGVVSFNPGLIFDNGKTHLAGDNSRLITKDKTIVALVGRVLLKVSLENGPIHSGDPLTSSSTPGLAMKATKAGKIIGYALEGTDKNGKVLVFLQPSYYIPADLLEQLNQLRDK